MTNLTRFLVEHAKSIPSGIAIIRADGSSISYAELDNIVNAASIVLEENGVAAGDVIIHLFSDETLALIFMLATARLGSTVYSIPEHTPYLQRSSMALSVHANLVLADSKQEEFNPGLKVATVSWSHLDNVESRSKSEGTIVIPEAPWLINTGSGTTGKPKLIEVSHSIFLKRMRIYSSVVQPKVGEKVVSLMHLDMPSAKNQLMNALYSGATVHFYNRTKFNPLAFCADAAINIVYCTSSHLRLLIRLAVKKGDFELPALRAVIPAGSSIVDDMRNSFVQKYGNVLYVRYGAAETGPISDALPHQVNKVPGTLGCPIEGITVEILDKVGAVLPAGEIGLIRILSPGVIDSYRDDEVADKRAFRNGWFYPGDLGQMTEDGQLVFCGRADDMMIMDGINIYPLEIEQVLLAHSDVMEAVAFPLQHDIYQEFPVCAVTIMPKSSIDADTLYQYARDRLGTRSPKKIVVLDSIPRNEQGKLIRETLVNKARNANTTSF